MKKKLLVSLSALILTAALVLTAVVSPASVTALNANSIGVAGANTEYEFQKAGFKNALDYAVYRDGFLYGADYNTHGTLEEASNCLGDNEITGRPASLQISNVKRDFYNMKAFGFSCTQWWLMWDLAGFSFDENGLATGVQDKYLANLRAILDIAREVGIGLIPTISNHDLLGNGTYGYAGELAYYKYCRFQYDPVAQDAWMENVIDPICAVLAEYPDVIYGVGVGVENMSGQVDDYDMGLFQTGLSGTTMDIYGNFYNRLVEVSKKHMPNIPTSIEMGGSITIFMPNLWERVYIQNNLDVDFVCENYYHSGGYVEPLSGAFPDRPGYLGEYNVNEGGANDNASEEYVTRVQQRANKIAKANGLFGAFIHRFSSMDSTNGRVGLSNYDAFKLYVTTWGYDMLDQKNDFLKMVGREDEIVKYEAPKPLYYLGGTTIHWINGRDVKYVDIERSGDGGATWKTVAKNLDAIEAVEGNGLGKYVDSTVEDNKTYRYRVTGIWADGTRITSVETNDAIYYVPPELVKDGGFESGKFAADRNDGWQDMGYIKGYEPANFITDENPKTGKYSLKIDTVNNNSSGYSTVWQTFPGTEAGKVYQVKWSRYIVQGGFDVKNDYNEPATCVLTNKSGGTIIAIFFSGDEKLNNKWLDHTFEAGVGSATDIGIKFMSGTANHKIIFYVDDISCKEVK